MHTVATTRACRVGKRPTALVAATTLALAQLFLLLLVNNADLAQAADIRYGLMIDAGSSGSRIYVYKYTAPVTNILTLPQVDIQQQAPSLKIKPGISAFADNPSGLQTYFDPLVNFAKNNVPADQQSSTFIVLGATAGMRLVNASQTAAIFAQIRTIFRALPFRFEDRDARVLSGEEEGVFGWLTVNYLSKRIGASDNSAMALDLGGASTQITFEASEEPLANLFDVLVANRTFATYTHSYLTWGRDQASLRMSEYLAKQQNTPVGGVVQDPCGPAGLNTTLNGGLYHINGTGNPLACQAAARTALLGLDVYCSTKDHCAINGVYQPDVPASLHIYAFSAFFYTFDFFGCSGTSNLACLRAKVNSQCALSWKQFEAMHANTDPDYLTEFCFNGGFILSLLGDGYRFPDTRSIDVVDTLAGQETGWTLGALIYKVGLVELGNVRADAGPGSSCAALKDELAVCEASRKSDEDTANQLQRQVDSLTAILYGVSISAAIVIALLVIFAVVKVRARVDQSMHERLITASKL